MAEIKLVYFNFRGRGEFIRLVLTTCGQKFEVVTVDRKDWGPEAKKESPYGQLPYMFYNGKKYAQSLAMTMFFARKFGLAGKTEEDGLRLLEVMQLGEDFRIPKIRDWIVESNSDKKADLAEKLKDETFPRFLGYYEELLLDNGGTGFFVGKSMSAADLHVYDILDTVLGIDPKALGAFPSLQKLRTNVEAMPVLKDYLASRPQTAF